MISTEIEGRLPYMTYPESWRAKQPPEFLRPAPKPLRYNGATTITNGNSASGGTRLAAPTPRTSKYSPPAISPVNLTAPHKNSSSSGVGGGDEPPSPMTADDIHYTAYRLFSQQQAQQAAVQQQVLAAAAASHPYYTTQPQPPPSAAAAQYNLYLAAANFHHHPIVPRPTYLSQPNLQQQQPSLQQQPPPPPLSPLDTYNTPGTPTSSTSGTGTYLSPGGSSTTSPYSSPPGNNNNGTTPSKSRKLSTTQASFKVPSGKEGSLKHRILTRPEDNNNGLALDLQSKDSYSTPPRRRLCATVSSSPPPPSTATSTTYGNSQHHGIKTAPAAVNGNSSNGGGAPSHHGNGGFIAKGTLVQLASGELRKVEDMRTEDFIRSADLNPALRLAESTVVRIDENHVTGGATVTLSYNERRTQVEMESSWEHPYFVMGHGWASCKPDLTLHCFGLKVYPLQVGDILVSLTPRESPPPARTPPVPILTTTIATSSHLPLVLPPAPLSLGGTSMVAHPSPMRGSHMTTTSCGPTIITTATSTAMTARTAASVVTSSGGGGGLAHHHNYGNPVRLMQQQPVVGVTSPDDSALRKRRWSSDHLSDEDSQQQHNRRIKID